MEKGERDEIKERLSDFGHSYIFIVLGSLCLFYKTISSLLLKKKFRTTRYAFFYREKEYLGYVMLNCH